MIWIWDRTDKSGTVLLDVPGQLAAMHWLHNGFTLTSGTANLSQSYPSGVAAISMYTVLTDWTTTN